MTVSDTITAIRNSSCIACGASFTRPRAGKFYCSSKCKQFAHYHKDEITCLTEAKRGITNSPTTLQLREYEGYEALIGKLWELNGLQKRINSTYASFEHHHARRLQQLEKYLPAYLRKLRPRSLTIEQWSFLKVLFSSLKNEDFIRTICSLDEAFYQSLSYNGNIRKQNSNPLHMQFLKHWVCKLNCVSK